MATYNPNKHVPSIYRPKVIESDEVQQEAISNHEKRITDTENWIKDVEATDIKYSHKYIDTMANVQDVNDAIDNHEDRLRRMEAFSAIVTGNIAYYVCPAYEEDSRTYIKKSDEPTSTKLVGNDTTGDGTIGNPFGSVNRAMRELKKYRAGGQIVFTIRLLPGIYRTIHRGKINQETGTYATYFEKNSDFIISHVDTNSQGRCSVSIEAVKPVGDGKFRLYYDESDDTPITLGDGTVLKNDVVFDYDSNITPSGSHCPFQFYSPVRVTGITFRYNLTDDKELGRGVSSCWAPYPYNGEGQYFDRCKIICTGTQNYTFNQGKFNRTPINPVLTHCYADNENRVTTYEKEVYGVYVASGDVYIINSTLKYALGIVVENGASVQLFMPAPIKLINKEWVSQYPPNILTFIGCRYGFYTIGTEAVVRAASFNGTPGIIGLLTSLDIIDYGYDDDETKELKDKFRVILGKYGNIKYVYDNTSKRLTCHASINGTAYKYTNIDKDTNGNKIAGFNLETHRPPYSYTALLYKKDGTYYYRRNASTLPDYKTPIPETGELGTNPHILDVIHITDEDLPAIVHEFSIYAIIHNLITPTDTASES